MADSEWTDELKTEVVDAYLAEEPTEENTMEIVKQLAENFNKTANGIRIILSRANVYVKKTASAAKPAGNSEGSKRVNKAEAITTLKKKIGSLNQEVDDDILDRLTGKAAVYINTVLEAVSG